MATSFLTRKPAGFLFRILLLAAVCLPAFMLLSWYLGKKRKLTLAIIDKTVLTTKGQEHISLDWILNQERFTKNDKDLYKKGEDYYGFFPGENESFKLKGLERFNDPQLAQLGKDVDGAYLTDTYGIFKNEWYKKGDEKEPSGLIYGGMSVQDLTFLKQVRGRHKLIITEFNCLGSPTLPAVSHQFEKMFGVKWTGWVGRYFDSFDTTRNKELPHWLINNYRQRHNGKWPFTKSGIALVHSDERVVILENQTHLNNELPQIYASAEGIDHYGMAKKMKYSFWFDIITVNTRFNHIISTYFIDANAEGKQEMLGNGIPTTFPAITAHINSDYRFFYFSGDFCDNPVEMGSSYFKKIRVLKWFMYNTSDPQERKSFFWELYRPLVTTILNDYYDSMHP